MPLARRRNGGEGRGGMEGERAYSVWEHRFQYVCRRRINEPAVQWWGTKRRALICSLEVHTFYNSPLPNGQLVHAVVVLKILHY